MQAFENEVVTIWHVSIELKLLGKYNKNILINNKYIIIYKKYLLYYGGKSIDFDLHRTKYLNKEPGISIEYWVLSIEIFTFFF